MGFMDKIKGAMNAVTGGGAKVELQFSPSFVYPGDRLSVRVTVSSTGSEIKSKGVFIDLNSNEEVRVRNTSSSSGSGVSIGSGTSTSTTGTLTQEFQIAQELVLAVGESKTFEGSVEVPRNVQPTYTGPQAKHTWQIRGRLEAWGNDPDSGWLPLRIGYRE